MTFSLLLLFSFLLEDPKNTVHFCPMSWKISVTVVVSWIIIQSHQLFSKNFPFWKAYRPTLIHSTMFVQTRHIISAPHTNCQHGGEGVIIWVIGSHVSWEACTHRVNHELLFKYSRVKCEAVCPAAEAWTKLCNASLSFASKCGSAFFFCFSFS